MSVSVLSFCVCVCEYSTHLPWSTLDSTHMTDMFFSSLYYCAEFDHQHHKEEPGRNQAQVCRHNFQVRSWPLPDSQRENSLHGNSFSLLCSSCNIFIYYFVSSLCRASSRRTLRERGRRLQLLINTFMIIMNINK